MKAELSIDGMTCNYCVMAVRKALAQIEGLNVEDVQIGKAIVSYDGDRVTTAQLNEAISKAGYSITKTHSITLPVRDEH